MSDDFHFKMYGIEVRAIGKLAILAAVMLLTLIVLLART